MPRISAESASRTDTIVEELSDVIHGINAPFACGGTLVPKASVAVEFRDGPKIAFTRLLHLEQQESLRPLLDVLEPAPFGRGRRTLRDRRVRDALRVKAEDDRFAVLNFDPKTSGVLDDVKKHLAPRDPSPLTAQLYDLNVYREEGHFARHKDTPRGDRMIGTHEGALTLDKTSVVGSMEELGDDVTWVESPPNFNFAPVKPQPMSETDEENPAPDEPAIQHLHSCEFSSTGYFGNEGSDTDFYVYAALHLSVPPASERASSKVAVVAHSRPKKTSACERSRRA